mgnify:CR=1 FL=1
MIDDAKEKGAHVHQINPANEDFTQQEFYKIPPTIITNTTDDMRVMNEEILIQILEQCKIDKDIFFKTIKDPAIKEKLKDATKNAYEKEVFGAPTFIVNNKIFWGQDRLEFALDEYNKID